MSISGGGLQLPVFKNIFRKAPEEVVVPYEKHAAPRTHRTPRRRHELQKLEALEQRKRDDKQSRPHPPSHESLRQHYAVTKAGKGKGKRQVQPIPPERFELAGMPTPPLTSPRRYVDPLGEKREAAKRRANQNLTPSLPKGATVNPNGATASLDDHSPTTSRAHAKDLLAKKSTLATMPAAAPEGDASDEDAGSDFDEQAFSHALVDILHRELWKTRDVAFRQEAGELQMKQTVVPMQVATLIPEKHHLAEEFPIPPIGQQNDGNTVFDEQSGKFYRGVFPKRHPSSRTDAQMLYVWATEMLQRGVAAHKGEENELQQRAELRTICQVAYNEVVRQVNEHCTEHASLLVELWSVMMDNFDQNKPLRSELKEIRRLRKELNGARGAIAQRDELIGRLEAQCATDTDKLKTFESREGYRMDELQDLRGEMERCQKQTDQLYKVIGQQEEENNNLKHKLVSHEQELLKLRRKLGEVMKMSKSIKDLHDGYKKPTRGYIPLPLHDRISNDLESDHKRYHQALRVMESFTDEGVRIKKQIFEEEAAGIAKAKYVAELVDNQVQTDPMQEPVEEEEEDEVAVEQPKAVVKKKKKKKKAKFKWFHMPVSMHKYLKGVGGKARPKSLRWLIRTITQMYMEKVYLDAMNDREGRERVPLNEYVHDFHMTKFGLKDLADQNMVDFLDCVLKYKQYDECHAARTFARMLDGASNPKDTFAIDCYLYLFNFMRTQDSGRPGVPVVYALENGRRYIAAHKLHAVVQDLFAGDSTPDVMNGLKRNIKPMQQKAPIGFPEFMIHGQKNKLCVDVDLFLHYTMEYFLTEGIDRAYMLEMIDHERNNRSVLTVSHAASAAGGSSDIRNPKGLANTRNVIYMAAKEKALNLGTGSGAISREHSRNTVMDDDSTHNQNGLLSRGSSNANLTSMGSLAAGLQSTRNQSLSTASLLLSPTTMRNSSNSRPKSSSEHHRLETVTIDLTMPTEKEQEQEEKKTTTTTTTE